MTASVDYDKLRFELSNKIHAFTNQVLSFENCKTIAEQFILRAFQSDLVVGEDGINALTTQFSRVTGNAEAGLELKEALPVLLMQSLYEMGIAPNAIKLNGTLGVKYDNFSGISDHTENDKTWRETQIAGIINPLINKEEEGKQLSRGDINAAIPKRLLQQPKPFTNFRDLFDQGGNNTPTSPSL